MSGTDCAVCKIIRTYLLFAVPLLALVGASTMDGGISNVPWFARVEIIDLLSWGCLAALVAIVSYRAYQEYYLPRKCEQALERAIAQFDEVIARSDDARAESETSSADTKGD